MQKRFIIRKYIWAKNVSEAIKLDKKTEVMDAWLDDDWKRMNDNLMPVPVKDGIGFKKDVLRSKKLKKLHHE